jgi:hypothetical protein
MNKPDGFVHKLHRHDHKHTKGGVTLFWSSFGQRPSETWKKWKEPGINQAYTHGYANQNSGSIIQMETGKQTIPETIQVQPDHTSPFKTIRI